MPFQSFGEGVGIPSSWVRSTSDYGSRDDGAEDGGEEQRSRAVEDVGRGHGGAMAPWCLGQWTRGAPMGLREVPARCLPMTPSPYSVHQNAPNWIGSWIT